MFDSLFISMSTRAPVPGDGEVHRPATRFHSPAAAEERLPVTWCVLNDEAFGSIRDIQELRFSGTEVTVQPDFAKIAEACGCYGRRLEDPAEVDAAIAGALAANGRGIPAVLDFAVARERLRQSREHYTYYPLPRSREHVL